MRKIFTLALAVLAPVANAADWQVVGSRGSSFFYMDFDSVATSGTYRKAWIKGEFYKPEETKDYPKKQYQSTKSLYYFDCGEKLLGSTQFIAYEKMGGAGEIVTSSSIKFTPKALDEVVPDTMGEKFLSVACASPAARAKIKKENDAAAAAAERSIQDYLKKQQQEKKSTDTEPTA